MVASSKVYIFYNQTYLFIASVFLYCRLFPPLLQKWSLHFWVCVFIYFFFQFFIYSLFWLHCTAYGILVPQPRIEVGAIAVKVTSPNNWTAREFPFIYLFVRIRLIFLKHFFFFQIISTSVKSPKPFKLPIC